MQSQQLWSLSSSPGIKYWAIYSWLPWLDPQALRGPKWKKGRISGLGAPGGRSVSAVWSEKCADIVISAGCGAPVKVKAPDGWTFADGTAETVISGEADLRIIR